MKKMWLARDKNDTLALYESKPVKDEHTNQWILGGRWMPTPDNWFPEVQWTDEEPTKVKLIIEK